MILGLVEVVMGDEEVLGSVIVCGKYRCERY